MLSVRLFTDPILHKTCQPIVEITDTLLKEVQEMLVTMRLHNGIGLAANQVGIDKQVCIVGLDGNIRQKVLLNPVIIKKSKEKETLEEGCLSSPGVRVPMKRALEVVVDYLALTGVQTRETFTGMNARVVQHELDHLNGILIVDKLKGEIR